MPSEFHGAKQFSFSRLSRRLESASGLREQQKVGVPYWNQGAYMKVYTMNVKPPALFPHSAPGSWKQGLYSLSWNMKTFPSGETGSPKEMT